jgi:hypothetical protein
VRGLELGQAGPGLERIEHRLRVGLEAEPRQLLDRLGPEHEVRAELPQIIEQALLGQVGPHAEVDRVAVIDRDPREHRQGDPIVEHELAALERERPPGTLRDQAVPELEDLARREPHGIGEHVDLVAIRCLCEPARDVGDLGRRDEVIGQRDARDRVGGHRRGCRDERAVVERDAVALAVALDRELARVASKRDRAQGQPPGAIRDAATDLLHQRTAAPVSMSPFDGVLTLGAMRS